MNRVSLYQGLAAFAIGVLLGAVYSKRTPPNEANPKPAIPPIVTTPIKPEREVEKVLLLSSAEKMTEVLIKMPLEDQMDAWDSACKALLAEGRWQAAVSLALLAPPIRIDERSVFPLGWVMKLVAKERASEAFAWLQQGVLSGSKRAGGGLAALLDAWQESDRPRCLQALREMQADSALLRYTRKNIILGTLRSDPVLVTNSDLERVFPASADPATLIRELGQALGTKDPARAIEWAKTLASASQRSYAVLSAATGAATSDHPAVWKILENVKDHSSREEIAGVWAADQYGRDSLKAVEAIATIPDPSLRSPAAASLLRSVARQDLPKAAQLAAQFASSGVTNDPWTALISASGIDPGAWKAQSLEPRLSFLAQLSPDDQARIFSAATLLSKPNGP